MTTHTTKINILDVLDRIEVELKKLYAAEPIYGFISKKYLKCGKSNCKCSQGEQFQHGPYYYFRQEPDYNYKNYLGKEIPSIILEKIEIGQLVRKLEKKRKIYEGFLTEIAKID